MNTGLAAVLTVTSVNSSGPGSLAQALADAQDNDTLVFNIPGTGPHYIKTPAPPEGYPKITADNLTIDGFGANTFNTNPILASNNAKIQIYLDSREGGGTVLDGVGGFGPEQKAILPIVGATNVTILGLGFLGKIGAETLADPALYCIAFAEKASGGHVAGCWFGVDADGKSVHGANAGIVGLRHRDFDNVSFYADDMKIGVRPQSDNPLAQFNVFNGMILPIWLEGSRLNISGNFIGVLPSGTNAYNNTVAGIPSQGAIQIGLTQGSIVIGTDGDGENDPSERNIFSGGIPTSVDPTGFDYLIQFYRGQQTNIVIAGNYVGVGTDGTTRFTNGVTLVSVFNPQSAEPWLRIGSDFDGVSDGLEGNVLFNNYPASMFSGAAIQRDFIDGIDEDAIISVRGNKLVNNYTPPVDPMRDGGFFLVNYYAKAIIDLENGVIPTLSTNSSVTRLIGTIPRADVNAYPLTVIDLYEADPEGIATGLAEGLPILPDGSKPGFVQGLNHLGTFFEGGSTDLNPEPGQFEFNVGALSIPEGKRLTITASYSQQRIGAHNPPTLTTLFANPVAVRAGGPTGEPAGPLGFSRNGGAVTITFTGVLQSSATVLGPWLDVPGASSPSHTLQSPVQTAQFFRARGSE